METWRLETVDNNGDLVVVEWSRQWRLSDWGVETTWETWRLGSKDDNGDLAAGEC